MNSNSKVQKLTIIAMLSTLSYVLMLVGRIPMVLFLKYDPKDILITIGGFVWGPFVSMVVSAIVGFIEFITVSDTGVIGLIMNVLASCAFACTAAIIYKKFHTIYGAFAGLITGCLLMTGVMLLWNYAITPLYMHMPRETIVSMLLPVFLPFNLIKGGINVALTLLLYKPIVTALRKAKIAPPTRTDHQPKAKNSMGVIIIALVILATCIVVALAMNDML